MTAAQLCSQLPLLFFPSIKCVGLNLHPVRHVLVLSHSSILLFCYKSNGIDGCAFPQKVSHQKGSVQASSVPVCDMAACSLILSSSPQQLQRRVQPFVQTSMSAWQPVLHSCLHHCGGYK
ncbi:hypothetical protein DUNSADRAFT_1159 [Dunaliella salina]|uniref:Encoded protein n=1 Tax=Dunaliella salina TaxID=3046 RepID=A0ABQ7GXF4_DUNSA|nr:hypothetical protein DUNSADRAFT_1159 [Dunaliella salina]|eukprot:KAF5839286.1 hypothetical protein DUNSADRAFT_1159 [Dunaliella salina]